MASGALWAIIRHPAETLRRVRFRVSCLRQGRRADELTSNLLAQWDHDAFIARFRPYWDPFPTKRPAKYLNLDLAVRESALRYVALGLFDGAERKRVLDIGCGAGYFLSLCRSQGHEVLGIDLDDEPLYNEMVDFTGLPRVIHRVSVDAPLPELDDEYDVISAFEVVFSFGRPPDVAPWNAHQWMQLLEAWGRALTPTGTIVVAFNRDPQTNWRYPPDLPSLMARSPRMEATFFGPYLKVGRKA